MIPFEYFFFYAISCILVLFSSGIGVSFFVYNSSTNTGSDSEHQVCSIVESLGVESECSAINVERM